jgi:hypothetical protein
MNERIKELLEQAGVKYVTMPKDTVYEKFAALLIEECIEVIWDNTPILEGDKFNDPAKRAYCQGMHDCMHLIEEHFGVES